LPSRYVKSDRLRDRYPIRNGAPAGRGARFGALPVTVHLPHPVSTAITRRRALRCWGVPGCGPPPTTNTTTHQQNPATQPTATRVLAELPHHPWVHLSCHGSQHPTSPTESAFWLTDGPLRDAADRTALSFFSIDGSLEETPGALMPSTMHDRTVLPPAETESLNKLLAAMRHERSERAVLIGPDNTRWELPAEAYRVLKEVLEAMSQGLAITVVPQHTMLTTQEAADLLGISRPTLVKLLESDQIPYEHRGRHRRLCLVDVLEYQRSVRANRRGRLDALVEAAETHGLYSATSTPKPTR
jgi:excisionase family DNA binding protein